jgi:hypothetical protein
LVLISQSLEKVSALFDENACVKDDVAQIENVRTFCKKYCEPFSDDLLDRIQVNPKLSVICEKCGISETLKLDDLDKGADLVEVNHREQSLLKQHTPKINQ